MKKIVLSAALLLVLSSSSAWAQATRTWVSGVGDDVNPCSRTAPCKTFAGAISKTAAGGEINAIDPGGFGAVTITKSITIDGAGTMASILASLTNGVNINAASGDKIILRNLSINGAGNGLKGIRFLAGGSLVVENCEVQGFRGTGGMGLHVTTGTNSTTAIINSTFAHNLEGVSIAPTAGTAKVTIDGSQFLGNASGAGLRVEKSGTVTVRNSVASGNATGFTAFATSAIALLDIESSVSSNNSVGIASGLGAGLSRTRVSNTMITGNGTGLFNDAAGTNLSWGNNKLLDNGTDGAFNGTLLPQ